MIAAHYRLDENSYEGELIVEGLATYYTFKRKVLMNLISGGSALVGIIVTSSLMKFFTDVIGLSPLIYGVVFLIFSIWNGINDPIIGYWADKRPFYAGEG